MERPVTRRGPATTRPQSTAAVGAACLADGRPRPPGPAYTLCAVRPYPGGASDEFLDGQVLDGFGAEEAAVAACRRYARTPSRLPRFDVPGATLLVVNDRDGNEVCRQPLLGVVCG